MSASLLGTAIDKIFSFDGMKTLDKAALVARYDVTTALRAIFSAARGRSTASPQVDFAIDDIPPQGIVLDRRGTYTFARDLAWSPPPGPAVAITIACDDVVLDLGGFTLTATLEDRTQIVTGILASSVAGVTIENGTLAGMGYVGIGAEHVRNLAIRNVTVDGLAFDNLHIRNACPSGIHVSGAEGVTIEGCTVHKMDVRADSSAGIQLLDTLGGSVTNCKVSDVTNRDGSVQGYSCIAAIGVTTSGCSAENFQSHFGGNVMTLGHTVLGFAPIFCVDMKYVGCSAARMTGCCDDCHGMSVFLDALVTVTDFTASQILDGVSACDSGAKATGLEVYGALVTITGCKVNGVRAINPQDLQSTGFSAWGWKITFTDCEASDVLVCDERGRKNPALGYGTGFGWAPDPRPEFRAVGAYDVTYQGCRASDCQVGFDTWFHVNSTWSDITTSSCDIPILVQPGESRTLSADPCSECNPPIVATITNIASGNTYPGSLTAARGVS